MTEVLEAELLSLYNFQVEKFKKEFDLKQRYGCFLVSFSNLFTRKTLMIYLYKF